ncbi:hypothetical protein EIP86_007836 [Pleurotus ostreatoroseus]|nr:hypothetical protein EIP86_007836 [Pleurotus ostreatoroseus]
MKRSAEAAFVVEQLPSPASSPAPSSSSECPPRKRPRSELTTEERKEARAHRNRIAAQNSRDRRKAQFTYLERRVAELELENRQLRADMGITSEPASPDVSHHSLALAKDSAREKENEELRARIKTLENGWDAVVKALAASGLPLNIPAPPASLTDASSSTATASRVLAAVAPPTPASPTPSTSSSVFEFEDFEPTRHLARVATTDAPLLSSVPQQRLELELRPITLTNINASASVPALTTIALPPAGPQAGTTAAPIDESTMEDLFREILAPSPALPPTPMPALPEEPAVAALTARVTPPAGAPLDWEGEAEMQRLLDMLPDVQPDVTLNRRIELNTSADFPSALDLDICAWDMGSSSLSSAPSVGVF